MKRKKKIYYFDILILISSIKIEKAKQKAHLTYEDLFLESEIFEKCKQNFHTILKYEDLLK